MLTQYDNDLVRMEATTVQRKPSLHSLFPLRTLQPQSSQPNVGRFSTSHFYKGADSKTGGSSLLEPLSYSPISSRCSSFSQESAIDSWEKLSTAPSSPQTPRSKHEPDDLPKLDSIPSHRGSLKRKYESCDENSNEIKQPLVNLPSVYCLLPPAGHDDYHPSKRRTGAYLHTPGSSPQPDNYCTSSTKSASSFTKDPIIQWLNDRRKESDKSKSLLPPPQWLEEGSLNIDVDFRHRPVFYREKQPYTPQLRGYCQGTRQQSSPPRDGAVSKKEGHNNIKYRLEETDYIRFNKYEMKLSWEENRQRFREMFPMADAKMDREKQGIQGVLYRENLFLPLIVDRGRRLQFHPNGHVKAVTVKIRDQGENKPYYSLVYLYPERALMYDWVPAKEKAMAAQLGESTTDICIPNHRY